MALINNVATISFKRLFLIDAFGALVTIFMLGFVLVIFEPYFGMPQNTLYILSTIAITLCSYSIICYFCINKNWKPYLKGIAIANLLYCCLTLFLIYKFYAKLTTLGLCYFVLEILIITSLALAELKKSSK